MTGSNNEDIEQEVYIRTWKNIGKYKETGKFKSWINTITALFIDFCNDLLPYINQNNNFIIACTLQISTATTTHI